MKLIPSIDVMHSTAHGSNIALAVPRAGAKMAGAAARAVRQTVARASLRELSLYTDRTLHLGRRVVSITRQLSVKSVQVRHKQLTASRLLQVRECGWDGVGVEVSCDASTVADPCGCCDWLALS
jgi:hypothetical protein